MNNIRWIVQSNLSAESFDHNVIRDTCKSLGIDFESVKVIPFSPDLPEFTVEDRKSVV